MNERPRPDNLGGIFYWALVCGAGWLLVLGWLVSPWLTLAGGLFLAVLLVLLPDAGDE